MNSALADALSAKGMEVKAFADLFPAHPRTIQRWLGGETTPDPFRRRRAAQILSVRQRELWPDLPTVGEDFDV